MMDVGAVLSRASARCAFAVVMLSAAPLAAAALSHFPDPMFHDGMEGASAGPFNDADAARFLAQATFGPTDADIAHLRALAAANSGTGYEAWLNEQFNAPMSSQLSYYNWVAALPENTGFSNILEAWFLGALGGPDPHFPLDPGSVHTDQLRQRVAFALSEIFVISDQNTLLDQHPDGLAYYYDLLSANAFGNYRTLLEQVTLSPQMGVYLNMQGNQRANLTQNLHPDENYAREINQLFSIGLVMLNDTGTPQLDGLGKPVPTYDQAVITAFSHVFTGWNWADCTTAGFKTCGYHGLDFQTPMAAPIPYTYHDNGTDPANDIACKQLLNYSTAANSGACGGGNAKGTLSSGGSPISDLAFALDNIFNHPNVGTFIGKQLIQRLVTSNPSPQYVQRITAVFNNDGSNVRGNLQAVVKAILLDPEARTGQFRAPQTFGKLREPLLRVTHLWRAMGATHVCGSTVANLHYANPYRYAGYTTAYSVGSALYSGVGQAPLRSDTVFNFFKPDYLPSGEMTGLGLVGPEFQIATDTLISNSTNTTFEDTFDMGLDVSGACGGNDSGVGNVKINRAQDLALAGNANGGAGDPADKLVDAYNIRFMSGQMSPYMRQTLLTALDPVSSSNFNSSRFPNWQFERISKALLLILTSPEYMVQK